MLEKLTGKKIFFVSMGVVGYFCVLCLNANILKSDSIFMGVLQELLTLPLMLFQLVLLFLSILQCIKDKFRVTTYSFWSLFILLASNLFIFISFLVKKEGFL